MRVFIRVLALTAVLVSAAVARDDTPSALERDPDGWTDLLAKTDSKLTGWTREPLPARGKLSDHSQWSLDPATDYLVCQGDGGHDWLRWDKELRGLHLPRRMAIHGRPRQEGLQLRSLRPQLGRCGNLSPGSDR